MAEPGEDALLRLAQSVADGRSVDWESGSRADPSLAARVEGLKLLASIADACRMPADEAPVAGRLLFQWGPLEILEKVGEGAYGEVFRGWDTRLEREVAVKFLRAGAPAFAAHVLQEGRHLARIRHPNVVTVHGAEEYEGRVGIWMEFLRGSTLEDLLRREGPFAAGEAMRIGRDLCGALAAVHAAGLVHRDVKPHNVIREESGRIVLMDLGAGSGAASAGGATLAGTPIYLAPEVLRGQPASSRSDLYALGVLLYRLVTGRYPVEGDTLEALRAAHARGDRGVLARACPRLPRHFVRVVERLLAPEPNERFETALEVARALERAEDAPRLAGRRRVRGGVVIVAIVAVAVVIVAAQRMRVARIAPPPSRPSVVVVDVVNQAQDAELDDIAGMLMISLEQSPVLSVLTRPRMTDLLGRVGRTSDPRIGRDLGLAIARRAQAIALLVPTVRRAGDRYTITLEAIDPRRNRRRFVAEALANDKQQVPAAIDELARGTRARLQGKTTVTGAMRPVAQLTSANLAAYLHFDRAERLIDRLELPGAASELEQAVAIDSTFGLAHSRLAYVRWWLSDPTRERTEMARAMALIDRVPDRERYRLRAQAAMADSEGLESARAILLEMERFYPDDKEMLYDIGDYSSHLNEFPTALAYLERVVAMDPGFSRALQHLARVARDMGRGDRFLSWAQRYAAVDSAWDSYHLLGDAQIMTGHAGMGVGTLARGRALAPERATDFTLSIANAWFGQGRSREALEEWSRSLDAARTPASRAAIYRDRAIGRMHQGAYRAALIDLGHAIELADRSSNVIDGARARVEAATAAMLGMSDGSAAFRYLGDQRAAESAITYRGTYFEYWPYWGGRFKLDLLAGRAAAAESLARAKFASDKWYGPYVQAYRFAARGECAQAAAAASQVLEWGPAAENIPLLYFLGRCELEHGLIDESIASFERLQSTYTHVTLGSPFYARSLLLIGEAHERRGDRSRAAQSYRQLLDLWRDGDRDLPDRIEAERRLAALAASRTTTAQSTR